MAFVASLNSRLYVGPLAWAAYTRGFDMAYDRDMLDVTTLVDTARQFIPGQKTATANLDLLLDTLATAGGEFALMNTWEDTPQVVTLLPRGGTIGNECWNILANDANTTTMSSPTAPVSASMSLQCDGNPDPGVVIAAEAAITTDTNGTSVDNGAATSNGGVAHLHVTAFSGLTSNSVIVEHSTNDSVWATLGTFASVTGTTSERLVIAPGTTVNRYLRIRDDVTGTGSCTRIASFARR